jgi:uncharacterized protein involved in exopolysaccharide biosynthesis
MSNTITYRNSPEGPMSPDDVRIDSGMARKFEIDLAAMFKLLLKRRRLIFGVVGTIGLLTAVIMLMTPNQYKSEATILPSGKSDNFSALRAMAGMAGGLDFGDDNSSTLFPVILRSNLVVDAVLAQEYAFTFDGEPLRFTLAEYIGKDKPEMARRALLGMTSVSTSTRTGEISLAVETEYPELSQAVVGEFLAQLESYNLHSRRSEATERVRYLARELSDRENALRASEDSLATYQNRNRNWAGTSSAMLLRDLARLKRDTEARMQTYAYLMQEYEIAKLDAQKDVPVVRILDQASLPTVKSGPQRTFTVLGASAVAFMLIVIVIFGVDLAQQVRRQTSKEAQDELKGMVAESFPRARRLYERVRGRSDRQAISVDN